jgi:hypothetical protein
VDGSGGAADRLDAVTQDSVGDVCTWIQQIADEQLQSNDSIKTKQVWGEPSASTLKVPVALHELRWRDQADVGRRLVHYRAMVQDMHEPEYHLAVYEDAHAKGRRLGVFTDAFDDSAVSAL